MELDDTAAPPAARGRVVMLLDGSGEGDSRIQKTVRSMVEAGWGVIVLGRSPDDKEHNFYRDGAAQKLIPVSTLLHRQRHEFRRSLRWPFAYPSSVAASNQARWVRAWQADLNVRRSALHPGSGLRRSLWASFVDQLSVKTLRIAVGAFRRWVDFRTRQFHVAQRSCRILNSRFDLANAYWWRMIRGIRCWRRLEPVLWDYELAYGKVIDRLQPDLIHANDFRMLGVGVRAALRVRAKGRPVRLVWEAREYLPGMKPRSSDAHWQLANCAHEREYARYADAVVTVSTMIADLLRKRHRLPVQPAVVLNAPELTPPLDAHDQVAPDIRQQCSLGPEVPLLVYSGAAAEQRGLSTMVEALPRLENAHIAFVVLNATAPYIQAQLARAAELGVRDRVHVLPYVPHWQVVQFLSTADVGVIPIHRWLNHEISLITKFFEYSHARLPLVVSDVRTMAEETRSSGQGEVFRASDVDDYVRAVRAVLADPQRYRAAYDKPGLLENWTWEAQAKVLNEVYQRLLPDVPQRELLPQ